MKKEVIKERKTTERSPEEKKSLINRLNLISGQVKGISAMVEEDRYTDDILIQLLAVCRAASSMANTMIESYLYNNLFTDGSEESKAKVDELLGMIKKFQN